MSGGVDSSVSALLLKQMGFDVVGVTFLLYESRSKGEGRTCCSTYDISDAERVAMKIKIPFYVMDMRDEFRKFIIENFVSEYKAGRTPIPCVHCNDVIKLKFFLRKLKSLVQILLQRVIILSKFKKMDIRIYQRRMIEKRINHIFYLD